MYVLDNNRRFFVSSALNGLEGVGKERFRRLEAGMVNVVSSSTGDGVHRSESMSMVQALRINEITRSDVRWLKQGLIFCDTSRSSGLFV